ncbi:hypothetical protein AMTRI_Chr12g235510 [Amborella trichopoda]|uniref:Secreted protein n=1 Tax=Amborella trichopoda TaxID=13333 RepID=W1P7P9_AMBTC|nr:hypothetical protein AMTR_s00144p00087390 [Amborella trichopoda]
MSSTCALETMGVCFFALLKFTGLSAQRNFPKFAIEEDCLSEISVDSIKKKATGGSEGKTQFSTRSCRLSLWIGLLHGCKKIALMTNSAVLRRTSVRG